MINIKLQQQQTKHSPYANTIHSIKISSPENILLVNNKNEVQGSILYEDFERHSLDIHILANRIVIENQSHKVLTNLIFKLINYLVIKGYRIVRIRGNEPHEQITLLKMKIEEELK